MRRGSPGRSRAPRRCRARELVATSAASSSPPRPLRGAQARTKVTRRSPREATRPRPARGAKISPSIVKPQPMRDLRRAARSRSCSRSRACTNGLGRPRRMPARRASELRGAARDRGEANAARALAPERIHAQEETGERRGDQRGRTRRAASALAVDQRSATLSGVRMPSLGRVTPFAISAAGDQAGAEHALLRPAGTRGAPARRRAGSCRRRRTSRTARSGGASTRRAAPGAARGSRRAAARRSPRAAGEAPHRIAVGPEVEAVMFVRPPRSGATKRSDGRSAAPSSSVSTYWSVPSPPLTTSRSTLAARQLAEGFGQRARRSPSRRGPRRGSGAAPRAPGRPVSGCGPRAGCSARPLAR